MTLLRAELLKVRTAPRTTLALVLALLAIVALGSASTASSGFEGTAEDAALFDVLEVVGTAAFFTLILGILIVTWEYRHGTITPTFLITPRRVEVVAAKVAASALAAVPLAVVSIAVALALALIWIDVRLESGHWELIARLVYAAVAWAVLGVGIGAVLQSQVGAIILAFVWFLIAEPLIGAGIDELGVQVSDYFPGAALERLLATDPESFEDFGQESRPYGVWGAAALVAVYAAAAAVAGAVAAERRDVS